MPAVPVPAATAPAVSARHHVRAALQLAGFRRLFGVRLLSQVGDGVFQASLAGAVLFDPERQAHAADVAAGFAVLLLPYSLIGPFAGVLLDRWWRQRVLVVANLVRAVSVLVICVEIASGLHGMPFYASALVVISTSRFYLSALSASLPHVVGADELVTANALSTTVGALATSAGGAAAIGLRFLLGGASAGTYAVTAACAAMPYAVAAVRARGFARPDLGPDDAQRSRRETAGDIARGLAAGAAHLRARRPALLALGAIGVHRLCYGLFAVCAVLLYRNHYTAEGPLRVGLAGLAQLVGAVAVGGGLAALITPALSRRLGYVVWSAGLLGLAGAVQFGLVLPYRLPLHLVAALLLGFCAQGIKICVDTVIQRTVSDEFRGRVFAFYDMLFNVALVLAAVLTAVVLPDDGYAPASVSVLGVVYLVAAAAYARTASTVTAAAAPTTA